MAFSVFSSGAEARWRRAIYLFGRAAARWLAQRLPRRRERTAE
jgi:hypothetical protein